MKFNRITINIVSVFITSIIIVLIYLVSNYNIYYQEDNKKEIDVQSNKIEIIEWEIKIPELMLKKAIVEENKDNPKEGIVHYKKSYIKNGTIILFCKEKLNKIKSEVSVFYKVNEEIFEYKTIENNMIKKENLDILLRR